MTRRGWWHQVQSGDYEPTQTRYGDPDALEKPKPSHHQSGPSPDAMEKPKPLHLHSGSNPVAAIQCSNCGHRSELNSELQAAIRSDVGLSEQTEITTDVLQSLDRSLKCRSCGLKDRVKIIP